MKLNMIHKNFKLIITTLLIATMLFINAGTVTAFDEAEDNVAEITSDETLENATDTTSLPARYNLADLGYVTSVKNVSIYSGTSWAFAAISASESNLIMNGLADSNIDLSENHLIYFGACSPSNDENDPLWHDGISHNVEDVYRYDLTTNEKGSTIDFSIFPASVLASWHGYQYEADSPFTLPNVTVPDEEQRYLSYYHLQNSRVIPSTDNAAIKQAIMETGAMFASFYYDGNCSFGNGYTAYYQNGDKAENTAVTIVGWDDNFSKANFRAGGTPQGDGAWIAQANWGAEWGDNGYFYISYYEKSLSDFVTYEVEKADNYTGIYQYDGSYTEEFTSSSGITGASVFTADSYKPITAVATRCFLPESRYTISIYADVADNNPTNGTLLHSQSGVFEYPGYYTVPLDKELYLDCGQKFSVVIDFPDEGARMAFDNASNGINRCFVKLNGNDRWYAIDTQDICIKAFTGIDISTEITEDAFPDEALRSYISAHYDTDDNGILSGKEITQVVEVDLTGSNVKDLTGIGLLKSLEVLKCPNLGLTSLDVSGNTKLVELDCSGNALACLNISAPSLSSLRANNNLYYAGYTSDSLSLDTIHGFDARKASNWNGAEYDSATNSLINLTSDIITYNYAVNDALSEQFTIKLNYVLLSGYSLKLDENISLVYHFDISPELLNGEGYFEFTMPNGSVLKKLIKSDYDDITAQNNKRIYSFSVNVPAKEMSDTISLRFVSGDGSVIDFADYSVTSYAEYICSHREVEQYENAYEAIKAILNYGTAAQDYFKSNTAKPANEILAPADRVISNYNKNDYAGAQPSISAADSQPSISAGDSQLSYIGQSLVLDGRVKAKLYFTGRELSEKDITIVSGISRDNIRISDDKTSIEMYIGVADFNSPICLRIGGITIENYSVYSYMLEAGNTDNELLLALVSAMTDYHRAVCEYVALGGIGS